MTEQGLLNFEEAENSGGFRLCRFEMLNWGTFDGGVRVITLNGENGLLTGDIGSGKSTVVDAITTLLIPPSKLLYNRAAGAEAKERTLKSYVEGYYKSERSEEGSSARPVALRGPGSYSVLLAWFHNSSLNSDLSLAQVFWSDGTGRQPQRLYATAEKKLSITENFSSFGTEMKGLRKKLRDASVNLYDSYPPYQGFFSRVLGIRSEQALNLFNQTVSMKTIGDLTGFVRGHMLEKFDAADRIKNLISHFDDLTGAHDAVLRAKRQVEALAPIEAGAEKRAALLVKAASCEASVQALDCWLARYKTTLYELKLSALAAEEVKLTDTLERLDRDREAREKSIVDIRTEINGEGGSRLQGLERELAYTEKELQSRQNEASVYNRFAKVLGLAACDDVGIFAGNLEKTAIIKNSMAEQTAKLQNELAEKSAENRRIGEAASVLTAELESLRARRTNIESRCVLLRARMTEALGIAEEELPFAGELIEVRREEAKWEGAAERLLHNFGLSLLVPDKYYKEVCDWVDKNSLGGRLVYYRVREKTGGLVNPQKDSLLGKLALKEDSPLYGWLASELAQRFDYCCCESTERFRREARAVTVHGQIKANEKRHEKDDRYPINDRSRYILGWNNKDKIKLLEREEAGLRKELALLAKMGAELKKALSVVMDKAAAASRLADYTSFTPLDWKSSSRMLEALKKELKELQASSRKLETLKKKLEETEKALARLNKERDSTRDRQTENRMARENFKKLHTEEKMTAEAGLSVHQASFESLEELKQKLRGTLPVTLESSEKLKKEIFSLLAQEKKKAEDAASSVASKLTGAMTAFKLAYILETQDFGADLESLPEYLRLLEQLRRDDLPRFEEKFHSLLHEKTLQEIASFHENLYRSGREIEARIKIINEALYRIDYEENRYIALEAEREKDITIREFQSDLRECTADSVSGLEGEAAAEKRFEAIEKIIARFKGRPEFSSEDRRWTEKVTDVRNWYSFAASERWRADDTESEHYSDSSGKSGGQKEKLAYTILAASLAYQFGLGADAARARTFRFVMIDEAFGRGSDESAQFALELFKTLRLQLLIVTPLQKLQVIEPYVNHVAFTSNRDGRASALSCMTVEEYHEQKEARDGADSGK